MLVAIIFDVLIVLLAVLGIIIGIKQGFVKMFILRFRRLASLIIAFFLAKPLGAILNTYFISGKMAGWLVSVANISESPAESPEALLNSVPLVLQVVAKAFSYDLDVLAQEAFASGQGMQTALITKLSYPIASIISVAIVFVVLFIFLCITLKLLGGMIDNIFELPVLKQINSILGAVVGLVMNAVLIWILCQLVGWLLTTDLVSGWSFLEGFSMESTFIAKYIYEFNPVAFVLSIKPE